MVCDRRARSGRWESVDGSSARSDGLRFAVDSILPVRIDRSERSRTSLYDDAESCRASLHELALRRGRRSATIAWPISIAEKVLPLSVRGRTDPASGLLGRQHSAPFATEIGFVRSMGGIVQRSRSSAQFPVETYPGQIRSNASSTSSVRLDSPAKLNSFGSRRCEGREFMSARNIFRLRPG